MIQQLYMLLSAHHDLSVVLIPFIYFIHLPPPTTPLVTTILFFITQSIFFWFAKNDYFLNEWIKLKEKHSEYNSVFIDKIPKAEFKKDLLLLIFML